MTTTRNSVGPNYDWAGRMEKPMRHQFPPVEWTPEQQKDLERAMKPEGLNPAIHCGISRGIANPATKIPLDNQNDSAVE